MRVDQAIYGEVAGGHALRLASDRDRLPTDLASRLDLPDTAPQGIEWSPFLSGFPHGDRYVVARTFADPSASRAGMVLSHALIVPLTEATISSDLGSLIHRLILAPTSPETLDALEIPTSPEPPVLSSELGPAAEALVARGAGPVVRLGTLGFDELVIALWSSFWPELRARFSFRLSFSPNDVVESPAPSLVCTPTALSSRWQGYRIIGQTSDARTSTAVAMLTDQVVANRALGFSKEIGAEIREFREVQLLARAYELANFPSARIEENLALVRLVNGLSPSPSAGEVAKSEVIDKLTKCFSDATADDVYRLRNLNFAGFSTSDQVWSALKNWLGSNDFKPTDDPVFLQIFIDALSGELCVAPWREAILSGLVVAEEKRPAALSEAFWRWAQAHVSVAVSIAGYLVVDHVFELYLSDIIPDKISHEVGEALIGFAASRSLFLLHGATAGATFEPLDAVRRHISVDKSPKSIEGVEAVLRKATSYQRILLAVETGEPRLIRIAANEAAKAPDLLRDIALDSAAAREVWRQALKLNPDAWHGPVDPKGALYSVLNDIIDGVGDCWGLVDELSKTPIAILDDYPRRSDLWSRLSDPALSRFLKATASNWVSRALTGEVAYGLEPPLEEAVLSEDNLRRALCDPEWTGCDAALRVVERIKSFTEAKCRRWIHDCLAKHHRFPSDCAQILGRMLADRQWRDAIRDIVDLVRSGRHDVRPALRVCLSYVGFFDRWALGLSTISLEEKWEALEATASELYPTGPDHDDLWERAGGRNADLQHATAGRSRWHDALAKIRRGKPPRLPRLLEKMSEDYPANSQVRILMEDRDFR